MTHALRYRRAARLEYDEAVAYYESVRPGLGRQFVDSVDRALILIRESPFQYPAVLSDVRRSYVRRFPYALYYRIRTGSVVMLSVFHARRDPMVWRERA